MNLRVAGFALAVIMAITQINIFATKAEMADLRAEIYREFMPRRETEGHLKAIDEKLDRLLDLVYKRSETRK